MKTARAAAAAAFFLSASAVFAEVQVTVSLSGSLDEMMQVLQQLQASGIGAAGDEGGIQLEVNSVTSGAVNEIVEPPELAFEAPTLNPPEVPETGRVLVMIDVVDGAHVVDTVTARLDDAGVSFDLYDNGMNGDIVAGDGVWTALMQVPRDLAPGEHAIVFNAYDAHGSEVTLEAEEGEEAKPLMAETTLRVPEKP